MGVSSTRYTMKSSPKDFAVLCLLLLTRVSLSSSTGFSTCSIAMVGSGITSSSSLDRVGIFSFDELGISFIGNMSSKKVASFDSIIVPTCMSDTSDLLSKIYNQCYEKHSPEEH